MSLKSLITRQRVEVEMEIGELHIVDYFKKVDNGPMGRIYLLRELLETITEADIEEIKRLPGADIRWAENVVDAYRNPKDEWPDHHDAMEN